MAREHDRDDDIRDEYPPGMFPMPDDTDGKREHDRPLRERFAAALPSGRMLALVAALAAVSFLSVGVMLVSAHADSTAGADRDACQAARTRLSDASVAWQTQARATRRSVDVPLLVEADPDMGHEMRELLKRPDPKPRGCDARAGDHARSMNADEKSLRADTRRLKTLTDRAKDKNGAYTLLKAQRRFDEALAEAERVSAGTDRSAVNVPYLMDRLDQEIERARALPRSTDAKGLDAESYTLEDLCSQIRESVNSTQEGNQ